MSTRTKIVVALGLAAQAFAREEYTRTFDKTLPLRSGATLRVDHKLGDITIRTQAKPEVVVHALIKTSADDLEQAKRFAEQVQIIAQTTSTGVELRTEYPEQHGTFIGRRNVSYSVRYEVTMPESSLLNLRNSFGSVDISDLKANADVTNSHGKLTFRNGRGTHRLENSFAGVEVAGNAGDINVTTTNAAVDLADVTGHVDVRDRFGKVTLLKTGGGTIINGNGSVDASSVSGPLRITTSFGAVTAANIKGALTVNNQNGQVEATGIGGPAELNTTFGGVHFDTIGGKLDVHAGNSQVKGRHVSDSVTITNSFAAVDIADVHGDLKVTSGNAAVTIADITGQAFVKTTFGLVHAERVGGAFTVEDNNGGVTASGLKNFANVRTSFSPVLLDGVAGPVDVENQNGAVEVLVVRQNPCQPVNIRTSFSPMRIRVPDEASYSLTAKTSFGKINSEFPMMVSGTLSPDSVQGKIGGGACPMRLSNQNGSIEILRPGRR